MNREEAIKVLEKVKRVAEIYESEDVKAYNMAIELLKQEPCEEAISRQAVIDLIEHYNSDGLGSVFYGYEQGVKFANAVNNLPSVTSQPKTGHWIEHKHNGIEHIECSECLTWFLRSHLLRNSYCPNCGKKMVQPQEREDMECI